MTRRGLRLVPHVLQETWEETDPSKDVRNETLIDLAEGDSLGCELEHRNYDHHSLGNLEVWTYNPDFLVLMIDTFFARAFVEAKDVGLNLCQAFILLGDRSVYDSVLAIMTCTELFG